MFETILVYVPETNVEAEIVQEAACVAKATNARILIYHPFSATSSAASGFVDPLNWSLKKTEAESAVKQICDKLKQDNIQADGEVIENDSIESFVEFVHKNNVTLIITEKAASNNPQILYDLMKTSAIHVLAIPDSKKPSASNGCFKRILIPLDGSKRAECTLPFAVFLSEKLNAEVLCVHVVQPPNITPSPIGSDDKASSLSEQLVEASRQNARDYLKQIASRFTTPIYTQVIVSSDVVSSIHQLIENENIDLALLSAHGAGGNPKWPFGSIASNLIAYSIAPVLLIQDLPALQTTETITDLNLLQRKSR